MVLNGNSSEKPAISDGFSGLVSASCLANALRRPTDRPSGANAMGSD